MPSPSGLNSLQAKQRVVHILHSELVAACDVLRRCDVWPTHPSRDGSAAEMWDQRVSEFVWYKMTHVRKKK